MKKREDPRHKERQKVVQELFASTFKKQDHPADKTKEILKHQPKTDEYIEQAAPQWPVEKIAKINLAILRLAVYELMIQKKTPPKVIIDEAVELAKEFGSDNSPSFINGVLGTLLNSQKSQKQKITKSTD